MYAALFQFIVFNSYIAFIVTRYGVLSSISESYYRLGKKNGYFSLFCFLLAIPMFFHSKQFNPSIATAPDYTFLFFISMLMCFTGAAAAFKRKITDIVHFTGAACGIVGAVLGIALQYNMLRIIPGWLLFCLIAMTAKKPVFWVEVVSFSWVISALFYIYFNK